MAVTLSKQTLPHFYSKSLAFENFIKPDNLEKVKHAAGAALAFLGLGILLGSTLSLIGYFWGIASIAVEPIHSFFMTGIACTLCGFHLAEVSSVSPSINAGPFTFDLFRN
jgi:hypothetical protein